MPERVVDTVNVPLDVIGDPETLNPVGIESATLVTVPTEIDPPNDVEVPLIVMLELVNAEFGMFVNVLELPDKDLFVNVCVPVRVATTVVSIAVVTAADPL